MAEMTEQQRERRRQRQRRWYERHREAKIAAVQKWQDANCKKVQAAYERRRAATADERLAAQIEAQYPHFTGAQRRKLFESIKADRS